MENLHKKDLAGFPRKLNLEKGGNMTRHSSKMSNVLEREDF